MNIVTFKGRQDGITVLLDSDVVFCEIESTLRDKITAAESFFGDSQAIIKFTGRELSDEQVTSLVGIIREGSRLEILEVLVEAEETDEVTDVEESETQGFEPMNSMFVEESDSVEDFVNRELADNETLTLFQRGSLRSGQSIRYTGSVVLMGDVNAGAEIIAEGNVIVMGAIKGFVHAGCAGDVECYVSALSMQPTQLRIADMLIYIPTAVVKKNKKRIDPVYAHIKDGEICTSPLIHL